MYVYITSLAIVQHYNTRRDVRICIADIVYMECMERDSGNGDDVDDIDASAHRCVAVTARAISSGMYLVHSNAGECYFSWCSPKLACPINLQHATPGLTRRHESSSKFR